MSTVEGVDYSTDHPDPRGLYQVGKRFAMRYGGPGTSPKHLTAAEAHALNDAGLAIVALAEGTETGLLGGAKVGAEWARSAHAHFTALGMPASRPIYLAVDFDVTSAQWPSVRQALAAAGQVLGPGRVGIYGGYDAVTWAARDNVAAWFFQAFAWSEGRWFDRAHVRQTRNRVSLVGGTVDLDTAMVSDYGQWTVGGLPPEAGGGELTPEEHELLKNTHFTLMSTYGPDGQPTQAHHVWTARVNEALAGIDQKITALAERDGQGDADGTDVGPLLTEVRDALREVVNAPLIDAVAVASAIASHPEIARQLAAQVAEQLATIQGSITLSGSLSGGIRPPSE